MNKRGFLGIGVLIVLAIFVIVMVGGLIAFIAFNKFIIIGAGLVVLTLIFGFKGEFTKQKGIFMAIFIGIGLVLILSSGVLQTTFQPLSITDASYNNGKILIYANTQGANALDITFSPSSLNNFLIDDSVKATKTSRLTAEIIDPSISFNYVTNFDNPVRNIEKMGEVTNFGFSSLDECRQKYPDTKIAVIEKSGWFSDKLGCYKYNIEGYVNGFPTGQTKSNNKIRFTLDGQYKDISSDNTQVSFNGATITWRGNLVSNTFITNPQYQVYRIGNSIRLVQSGADSKARTEYNALSQCLTDKSLSALFGGESFIIKVASFNDCKDRYENQINGILRNKESEYISNTQGIKSINTISNGVLKANLDTPTFIPTFTIELDASKVGIVKLSGQPDITSCPNDVTLDGSGSSNTRITVKNTGEQDGYFIFQTSTNNPDTNCQINPVSINRGSSKTIDVFYSGSIKSTSDVSGTCNIKVYDSNDNSKSDTCNFNINVKYEPFVSKCSPEGLSKCSADTRSVLTCQNGFWVSTLCNTTCIIKDNKASCSGVPPPEKECAWYQDKIPSYTAKDCGFLNWKKFTPFVSCVDKTYDSRCKTPANWIYWVGISIIIGGLGAYAISVSSNKKRKRR